MTQNNNQYFPDDIPTYEERIKKLEEKIDDLEDWILIIRESLECNDIQLV